MSMTYTVFMKYNPGQPNKVSKYNKDMIEFLNKNIDSINGTGTEVHLVLIDEDDNQTLKELSKKGVSKVPALLGRNIKEPIQKVDKIKKFLLSNAKNKRPIPKKGSDEELRDYQLDVMDPTGDEPDDDEFGNGDSSQRTAQINARLEFEKRRRDARNPRQGAAMSAADIIAQQKRSRGRGMIGRRKPPAPKDDRDDDGDDDDEDDEDEDPKPRRRGRRPERNNNMDDPAAIMANERPRNQDEAVDNDLMSKFWAGRGVGGGE